jgi:putative transposase
MQVSLTTLCKISGIPRSTFYYQPGKKSKPWICDKSLEYEIKLLIDENPRWGLRMILAVLRKKLNRPINRKKVHRIMKHHGWQAVKRPAGKRPRVQQLRSRTTKLNERWAIDTTHIMCGVDGWCHLTAIIDCCNREIIGYRFSQRGIAKVAAGALEDALSIRKPVTTQLTLRSDNGLVFGAKDFVRVVSKYGLSQEYITPYTPEQNGMIERFFRTLKEECVWNYRFQNYTHAQKVVDEWIHYYNTERPHSALGYHSPVNVPLELVA